MINLTLTHEIEKSTGRPYLNTASTKQRITFKCIQFTNVSAKVVWQYIFNFFSKLWRCFLKSAAFFSSSSSVSELNSKSRTLNPFSRQINLNHGYPRFNKTTRYNINSLS